MNRQHTRMGLPCPTRHWIGVVLGALAICLCNMGRVHAAEATSVIVGKNGWLFTPYEFANPADSKDTQSSLQLLQSLNRLFVQNGIALALVIVPSKIRIHQQYLPDNRALDQYTAGKYDQAVQLLRSQGVQVVDLNAAFMASEARQGDAPLFLRQDTHWAPAGALLAAQTVKIAIEGSAVLRSALDATQEEAHSFSWLEKKITPRARDLLRLLPEGADTYPPEQTQVFRVERKKASQAGLLSGDEKVSITLIGSSYSSKTTGFPDALRYTLQRELLDISIPVDQGPWRGMQNYLRDGAFKTSKPKLIIWEIPERELRSPPNYIFRDNRYIMDNSEWMQNMTNLLQ